MHTGSYSKLVTRKNGKHNWVVEADWATPFGVVPLGFQSDGASIPRIFWWFADPAGEFFEAAVLHDYLYNSAIGTKDKADLAFYQTALHFKATTWKAKVAYYAVKLAGRGSYV